MFYNQKINITIILFLLVGVIFRFFITANGNFIFNMDNARDMVDVRGMVVLGHLRLIGPTTAIEGFFYGPGWYYLLSVPFILSGGNPYASIVMEIVLWLIGGYYLLSLSYRHFGLIAALTAGSVWIASNFIILATQYAFNPNPILFLTPVFIYLLIRYLEKENTKTSLMLFFLAGLFLHFEIAVGIFMPLIILVTLLVYRKLALKKRSLWFGVAAYFTTFIPQIIFELRHDFFLFKSLVAYRSGSHGEVEVQLIDRLLGVLKSYYDTLLPTFMNFEMFTNLILILGIGSILYELVKKNLIINKLLFISLLIIIVPLLGLIPLKVELMRWHLNSTLVGSVFLAGFIVQFLIRRMYWNLLGTFLLIILISYALNNMNLYMKAASSEATGNSYFKTEVSAIDYVYQKAAGLDFEVYVYLPSVIDYPYQYLFWWHGLKKYGYLPKDYSYAPNVPDYIKDKQRLDNGLNPPDSNLVFLIKEPDQTGRRHLWENQFKDLNLESKEKVGSLEIEIRTRKD